MRGIPVCIQAHKQIFTIDVKTVPMHVHYVHVRKKQMPTQSSITITLTGYYFVK